MIQEILSGKTEKHLTTFNNFLIHPEAKDAFLLLQADAKKDGFDLQIISAFRSYKRQFKIWNEKASGLRPLYSNDGQSILNFDELDEQEIVDAILRWSTLPGASRHHWGTDIDVFDQNQLPKEKVQLLINECEQNGPFYELHQWLDQKIARSESSGFFRPYNADLGGISPERWHLSYSPVASQYLTEYSFEIFCDIIENSEILLKSKIKNNLQHIYNQCVTKISL